MKRQKLREIPRFHCRKCQLEITIDNSNDFIQMTQTWNSQGYDQNLECRDKAACALREAFN